MKIRLEAAADRAAVETLVAEAFGPERFAKTVYMFRDGVPPVASLSLVAEAAEGILGSLRFWPVEIAGATPALLLGPLVTAPAAQGQGIGSTLMREGLARAAAEGHRLVILVGDEPYYRRFGFSRSLTRRLQMPGWVAPERFLARELMAGAMTDVAGPVGRVGETVEEVRVSA